MQGQAGAATLDQLVQDLVVANLEPDEAEQSDLTNQAAIGRPWELRKRKVAGRE